MVQTIDTCEDLVAQIDELGVIETVKAHRKPPLLTRILRDLYELYHDQDRYLSFLAHYPLIPSDLAEQIASTLDPQKVDIAIGLAGNPRCPQQSLSRLVKHSSVAVRHALAENTNLTPKEFQALVSDENEFVRAALAQNTALPNPLQFVLAEDRSSAVRIALTERKNLDTDVAVHLANSADSLVSAATILNHSLDEELLQLWADNNQAQQQLLLLKRPKPVPAPVHAALRLSFDPLVCRTALQGSELSGPEMLYLLKSEDTRDQIFLAEQSDLPASIQRLLAQDASPRVRGRLAANNSIHESIALHIVASNDLGSCRALAKNEAASDATLRELCLHPEDDIALLVAYRDDLQNEHYDLLINHRTSLTIAEHIAYQDIEYSNFTEESAQRLASHATPSIRAFAARSVRLNEATRNTLINDPSPLVRERVAANRSLNERQLRILLEDTNRDVIFAAEENAAQRIRQQVADDAASTERETTAEAVREAPSTTRPRKGALFNKIANFFTD
jgi:hypothetical protein